MITSPFWLSGVKDTEYRHLRRQLPEQAPESGGKPIATVSKA